MRRKLLLADDSVTIQRVIELTFADEDIDVVAVGDGDAAIARLNSDPPDIVLADTGMPGRDGYEVAAHVHKTPALAGIPVILLTGALQPVDEVRAREAGCAGVLVKPFEPHMVISRVRELLDRRGGSSPAASSHQAVPDSTAGTPADAILNAPPSEHAKASSPDDYFARLDAAFATLDAPPAKAKEPSRPPAGSPPTVPAAPPPAVPPQAAGAAPRGVTMADAFTALLALEQGRPAAMPGGEWSAPLSEIVDEISRRVAEQVADRVIRELAPEIVAQVAERVVRQEMARLRQEAESSSSSS